MEFLSPYLTFIIPIITWFITQGTKVVVFIIKHGWNPYLIYKRLGHGHMPSAHTAFVVSLATAVGYYHGIDSAAFAVASILAIIIIDDSVRLRVHMGDQGRYLNMLIRQLPLDQEKFPRLKERIGHRVSEVIVGGIFGFILTLILAMTL